MAYFLDPELAASTPRPTPSTAPRSAPKSTHSGPPNKFGKACKECRKWVEAGEGYLGKLNGQWVVYCKTCP